MTPWSKSLVHQSLSQSLVLVVFLDLQYIYFEDNREDLDKEEKLSKQDCFEVIDDSFDVFGSILSKFFIFHRSEN